MKIRSLYFILSVAFSILLHNQLLTACDFNQEVQELNLPSNLYAFENNRVVPIKSTYYNQSQWVNFPITGFSASQTKLIRDALTTIKNGGKWQAFTSTVSSIGTTNDPNKWGTIDGDRILINPSLLVASALGRLSLLAGLIHEWNHILYGSSEFNADLKMLKTLNEIANIVGWEPIFYGKYALFIDENTAIDVRTEGSMGTLAITKLSPLDLNIKPEDIINGYIAKTNVYNYSAFKQMIYYAKNNASSLSPDKVLLSCTQFEERADQKVLRMTRDFKNNTGTNYFYSSNLVFRVSQLTNTKQPFGLTLYKLQSDGSYDAVQNGTIKTDAPNFEFIFKDGKLIQFSEDNKVISYSYSNTGYKSNEKTYKENELDQLKITEFDTKGVALTLKTIEANGYSQKEYFVPDSKVKLIKYNPEGQKTSQINADGTKLVFNYAPKSVTTMMYEGDTFIQESVANLSNSGEVETMKVTYADGSGYTKNFNSDVAIATVFFNSSKEIFKQVYKNGKILVTSYDGNLTTIKEFFGKVLIQTEEILFHQGKVARIVVTIPENKEAGVDAKQITTWYQESNGKKYRFTQTNVGEDNKYQRRVIARLVKDEYVNVSNVTVNFTLTNRGTREEKTNADGIVVQIKFPANWTDTEVAGKTAKVSPVDGTWEWLS